MDRLRERDQADTAPEAGYQTFRIDSAPLLEEHLHGILSDGERPLRPSQLQRFDSSPASESITFEDSARPWRARDPRSSKWRDS